MNSTFKISQGQGQMLEFAFDRNGGTNSDLNWLCQNDNLRGVIDLARGKVQLVYPNKPSPQLELCPVVHLDQPLEIERYDRAEYGDDKQLVHHKLGLLGPKWIAGFELWQHDLQRDGGWTNGRVVYEHLERNDMLKSCCDLFALEVIRNQGAGFFRKHFGNDRKAVVGWAGIAKHVGGNLCVPYLAENRGRVYLHWMSLTNNWNGSNIGLRYIDPPQVE
jgi:hypothetical protein